MMLADLRYRLRALFRRDAMERELADELGFHLEQEIGKHSARACRALKRNGGRGSSSAAWSRSGRKRAPCAVSLVSTRCSWRVGATMFVTFAALALTLAGIGLYSVVAYAVAQRTREIGVRIALGARMTSVMVMIVRQGVLFALSGIIIGGTLALFAGRWIEPLLFSASPADPLVYAGVAGLLLVIAIAATVRPALRASRVDPTVALRAD